MSEPMRCLRCMGRRYEVLGGERRPCVACRGSGHSPGFTGSADTQRTQTVNRAPVGAHTGEAPTMEVTPQHTLPSEPPTPAGLTAPCTTTTAQERSPANSPNNSGVALPNGRAATAESHADCSTDRKHSVSSEPAEAAPALPGYICSAFASLAPNGGVWAENSPTGALAIYGTEREARGAGTLIARSPIVPVYVVRADGAPLPEYSALLAERDGLREAIRSYFAVQDSHEKGFRQRDEATRALRAALAGGAPDA